MKEEPSEEGTEDDEDGEESQQEEEADVEMKEEEPEYKEEPEEEEEESEEEEKPLVSGECDTWIIDWQPVFKNPNAVRNVALKTCHSFAKPV